MKVFGSVSEFLLLTLRAEISRREAIFVSSAIKWLKCRRVGRDVLFGSKADICDAGAMSALPPKADIGRHRLDVRLPARPPHNADTEKFSRRRSSRVGTERATLALCTAGKADDHWSSLVMNGH